MANAEAGWYPDPSGDITKLRYWDGMQWTDSYAPSQAASQTAAGAGEAEAPREDASSTGQAPYPGVNSYNPNGYASGYAPQGGVPYGYGYPGQAASPYGATPGGPVSETDRTLRLIAFIFMVLTTVSVCWLIIPLAWMIPMTVHSWGIYKGTKANTTAFGVCTLIFCGLVAGILLLVSQKDQ